jgi:RHS repeat-associated protein
MRLSSSPPRFALITSIVRFPRLLLRHGLIRKLLCLAIIINLLIWPSSGIALRELPVLAATAYEGASDSLRLLPKLISWLFPQTLQRKDKLSDRLAAVFRLQISPAKLVGYQGDTLVFTALPNDRAGSIIQGVKFSWESSDTDKLQIDEAGRASLLHPGRVTVTCRAGSASAQAALLIRPGNRPSQSDAEWKADQASFADSTSTTGSTGEAAARVVASLLNRLAPTAHAQSGSYFGNDFPYDELYTDPANLIGSPRNRAAEPTRMGAVLPEARNFKFALPIVGTGGRGIGAGVVLNYNSRLWSRHGNAVTYDATHGWPSPGFSLGFGRIVVYGPTNSRKYLLIDPDGTRRFLGTGGDDNQVVTLQTSDGTHTTYVGNSWSGTLYYPGGTRVTFYSTNNRLVPGTVQDKNGNYITITYLDVTCDQGCQGCSCPIYWPSLSISQITDSLGRIIKFNYDTNLNLTSIDAPGFGGTVQNPVTRTVARFSYESRSVSGSFTGLTVENRPTQNVNFIKKVYLSETGKGVLFGYSDFGMIHTISTRRQMSVDGQGSITDGLESASTAFNYPTSGSLSDVPAFTQRTENAVNSPTSTYTYSSSTDGVAQTKTFTITQPDSSQVLLTRSTNTSSAANGLLTKSEVKSGSTTYAKTEITYANDPGGSAQVESVIVYDDAAAGVKVGFEYDQYGNVTNKREYGYQVGGVWKVQRRTRMTYKTDTAYINEYLRGLVTQVEVLERVEPATDADNVITKSAMTYDNYGAMGGMENYGGTASPPGHLTSYDTTKTVRGNVTGSTRWSDIAGNTSYTRLMKFDIFGNVVKAQVSCCNEIALAHTDDEYWSKPENVTRGNGSAFLTSTSDYDFNTSLTNSQTDPNSLTSNYSYDSALRAINVSHPGVTTPTATYGDNDLSVQTYLSYIEGGVPKTISTRVDYDGWGRPIKEFNIHNGQVDTTYDSMGQVQSRTNTFTAGGQPGPQTSYTYDALGRPRVTTLPGGNTVENTYSGNTATAIDQVNRKIKSEVDGLGRLVKVTEQDASGLLTQETTYIYNVLDKLVQVNQGGQLRSYKYDALGRLLYEKVPEQQATLSDGAGGLWSMKYVYNSDDAVVIRTDPRGVETHYKYDELHRLIERWYTGPGGDVEGTNRPALPAGVNSTPTVLFNYDNSQSSATTGLLLLVSTNAGGPTIYQESYSYDSYNRLQSRTWTRDGQSHTVDYQYNVVGQITQAAHQYYDYDDKGRPKGVKNSIGQAYLTDTTYNIAGQVTGDKMYFTGEIINESYGYDANRLQMTSQSATRQSTGAVVLSLNYSYQATAGQMGAGTTAGNAGQLMSITNSSIGGTTESAAYTYDLQGRLATSNQTTNSASAQRRFSYDRWGNRTAVWDAVTGGNQIQSVTLALDQPGGVPTNRIQSATTNGVQKSYTYDAAGNVTNDGTHSYTYNAENQVAAMDWGQSNGHAYAFDPQNRRIKKFSPSGWTHSVWEGQQVIAEYNHTGAAEAIYYYFGSRLVRREKVGQVRSFLSDKLSLRVMLDGSSNVVGRQGHLPYGEELGTSGEMDKHRFTSYERDSESGMDYALNRSYSPAAGRFAQTDPYGPSAGVGEPQSWNRYTYVYNNPINATDRNGLDLDYTDCTTKLVWTRFETNKGDGYYYAWVAHTTCKNAAYTEGVNGEESVGSPVGIKAKFGPKTQKKYNEKKVLLIGQMLNSKPCADFLSAHGISITDAIDALALQRPFDGEKSTITRWEAGAVDPNDPIAFQHRFLPMSSFFGRNSSAGAVTGLWPLGELGTDVDGRSDVYFNPDRFTGATILHEALHSLTGKDDAKLAQQLGLSNPDGISDALRANKCIPEGE